MLRPRLRFFILFFVTLVASIAAAFEPVEVEPAEHQVIYSVNFETLQKPDCNHGADSTGPFFFEVLEEEEASRGTPGNINESETSTTQ